MGKSHLALVKLHENKQYLNQVCDLLNEYWPRSLAARLHSLNKSNDNYPCNYLLVDLNGDQVVGHVTVNLEFDQNDQKVAYIESLIIAKDHRKQGLGRFLMAELERMLIRDQFKVITLKTIDQVGFYESIGFKLKNKVRSHLIGCRKNAKQPPNQPEKTPDIEPVSGRPADDRTKSSTDLSLDQQKAATFPLPPPLPPASQSNFFYEYHMEKQIDLNFTATDSQSISR